MKKYPKKLWALMWTSGSFSAYTDHKTAGNGSKCYHLHPGNEVARALNTILLEFEDRRENNISTKLRKAGFPVRWDAKKGKFK